MSHPDPRIDSLLRRLLDWFPHCEISASRWPTTNEWVFRVFNGELYCCLALDFDRHSPEFIEDYLPQFRRECEANLRKRDT